MQCSFQGLKSLLTQISISDDGYAFQQQLGIDHFGGSEIHTKETWLTNNTVDPLHTFDDTGKPSLDLEPGPYLPRWQTSPVLKTSMVNEDLFLKEGYGSIAQVFEHESAVLGSFVTAPPGSPSDPNPTTAFFATLRSMWEGTEVNYLGDPMAHLHIPIFDYFNSTKRNVVGILTSTIHWRGYLRNILPSNVHGITVVLHNHCEGFFTYEIHGDEAYVVGFGDQHESRFDEHEKKGFFNSDNIKDGTLNGIKFHEESQESCLYDVHIYPTEKYHSSFVTDQPMIITFSVALVFFFTILMFLVYDRLVERRQTLVLAKATQSTAIVSSLFPRQVRDRLLNGDNNDKKGTNLALAPNHGLKTFLKTGNATENENESQPIADLFPNCTVFFSDITGFTAWSSTREPAQVFILLQSVYQAFDTLAKRRKVFKVETIGDSYMAVTGLPEPQDNHAIIMARFAYECLLKIDQVTKELEVSLGPDTGDLSMRFGLHSGPVTAGVLRGDRARFQLFGDTVNTGKTMAAAIPSVYYCSVDDIFSPFDRSIFRYSLPNGKYRRQGQDPGLTDHSRPREQSRKGSLATTSRG
jgi:class 3 adenylate cyclase